VTGGSSDEQPVDQVGASSTLSNFWRSPDGKVSVPVSPFQWQLDEQVTIGRAVVAATQRLASAGLDSPRLDSEVLLAHQLGLTRSQLYTHSDRILSAGERAGFEELIKRRFRHEPVAYLVGTKAFYGLDLAVDPRVLIPRPETEQLVDLALDLVGKIRAQGRQPVRLADIGTGSGAIALAVAANAPSVEVWATDISPAALALAQDNARRLGLASKISFLHGNLLAPVSRPVHLIVANLPYIAEADWPGLQPDITDFEPALALSGGADGLATIRDLLNQAPAYLEPGGAVLLEIGSLQGKVVAQLAVQAFPYGFVEVLTDYAYQDRIVRVQT
jgi:release factor glutamine methyltransferase